MRVLGLDVGDKRIGVALSDPLEILASALTVIPRSGRGTEYEAIVRLIEEHGVKRIVVGLPRLPNGGMGTQAEKTKTFVQDLAAATDLPIEMYDERLSSSVAEQRLKEAGKKRSEIRQSVDAAAAALILQWYLDEKGSRNTLEMENGTA